MELMEPIRPNETEKENNEVGNNQPLIGSAVVIGIVLALVVIIEMGGLQLWEWIQSLEEVGAVESGGRRQEWDLQGRQIGTIR